jgi:hypothetical protein
LAGDKGKLHPTLQAPSFQQYKFEVILEATRKILNPYKRKTFTQLLHYLNNALVNLQDINMHTPTTARLIASNLNVALSMPD